MFLGSDSADEVAVSQGKDTMAVDLNGEGRGPDDEPELLTTMRLAPLIMLSGPGDDFISAESTISSKGSAGRIRGTFHTGSGDDVVIGTPGRDEVDGGPGKDRIRGLGGDDGGTGVDTNLTGGRGTDTVFGGTGNDVIGGYTNRTEDSGRDELFGGPGSDSFIERDGFADAINCGPGVEEEVQSDRLDILSSCAVGRR
ncbi:MAG: hypothetical protein JJE13_13045 [Thermoleophilia bacterium]|nr:hypothetical protein [Thermoleophilia bacterium]